ncbi:MAG: hypothetical protein P4M11_15000 [Candidatus Pacebacteria bacterium]|nr:hypothetical protein [Candidatus Paceibacterota bacterium]
MIPTCRLYSIIFGSKAKIWLIMYWAFLIIAAISSFYNLKHNLKLGLISSRKLFHVLTMILFLPGFINSVPFVSTRS